ncbi:CLUMA_CG013484, isoform A [Clunio marinus]|uniref:CLUMA_CG013484, isoform A n=1 Tax=Clunio marinus TaxID=568069 RepID=A0A1J1IKC3_9DIPT|nr:CLUMA_CG013484, isoform A [Clunio marinus]
MSSNGDESLTQMNGSESLSSILTRSSNSSQRQKTLSVSSAEEPLHVADVADLLHPQYAIITGGRSMDTGSPLITFPDHNNFHLLCDRDYQRLIQYLIGVTSLQDADLGFQLIIDRRKNSWASVKATFFPGLIQCVYVIRPSGFFQKAISEVSSKFFKEEFRFRVIICAQIEELHEFIHPSQLTSDLSGSLFYSHHEWIQQRISLEKFSCQTTLVAHHLETFMRQIHDTEFPNSVEATEQLLIEQGTEYTKLKDEILSAGLQGEELLAEIRKKTEMCVDRIGNISSIERRDTSRLIVQLQETELRFDQFYEEHMRELRQCLELRRFEHDFRELQSKFDGHLRALSEMTEIGDTVTRIDHFIEDIMAFKESCEADIIRADEAMTKGQSIIDCSEKCSSKDMVEPKCNELTRIVKLFNEKLSKRAETLTKARDLMERIDMANEWCAKGIDLLASQRIENVSVPPETAEIKLHEIIQFIESAEEFQLSNLRDYDESTSLESIIVSQVLQRIDDVKLMCEKRIVTLKKLATKPSRPIQTVTPEPAVPLQPNTGAPHLRHRKHSLQRVSLLLRLLETKTYRDDEFMS